MELCEGPNWSVLPEEMKELILSKVPLVDLAHASATSKIFQAVFRRELAQEQKACSESAVELLGHERFTTIVTLIDRVLKGEAMKAYADRTLKYVWILHDGTCQKGLLLLDAPDCPTKQNVEVRFWVREERAPHDLNLYVRVQDKSWVSIRISSSREPYSLTKSSWIASSGIAGVAIVQALLSKGLAQMFHSAGHEVRVEVRGGRSSKLTQAGFKAVVAPLMPFIKNRRLGRGELLGVLRSQRSI